MDIEKLTQTERYVRFSSEVLVRGADSTLPHNLDTSWLVELIKQSNELTKGEFEVTHAVEFIAALKQIHLAKNKFEEIPIDETTLTEYIEWYSIELKLEKMSRDSDIKVTPPTISNILTNRYFELI